MCKVLWASCFVDKIKREGKDNSKEKTWNDLIPDSDLDLELM
jgi:hypothetical protein